MSKKEWQDFINNDILNNNFTIEEQRYKSGLLMECIIHFLREEKEKLRQQRLNKQNS